ncbi:MAG: four helix bundle protein [Bacteroidota bacterium]
MNTEELKHRFKMFAIEVALLIQDLPKNSINIPYCNQLVRSSSSPGANYRAACRAKSSADFINKLKIVEEELDESVYFMELLLHFNADFEARLNILIKEGNELLAITVSSLKTARENQKQ